MHELKTFSKSRKINIYNSEIKALTLRERVESHLRLCETLDTSILKLSSAYTGEDSGVCCRGLVERRVK